MGKKTIAFRLDEDNSNALQELARLRDRDLSHLINEAVEQYLELHRRQAELIRTRLDKADNGAPTVAHDDVFARLRARIEQRTRSNDAE